MADVVFVGLIVVGFVGLVAVHAGGGSPVIENVVGLVIALGLVVYLVAALLFPERF